MKNFMQTMLADLAYQPERLLEVLRRVQSQYQFIPSQAIDYLADELGIPRTQIIAVIEFYSFFHLTPQGQYQILLSDSITDRMLGKVDLATYLEKKLNLTLGQVRADGLVSLNNTSCTGLCDQGPAALINGYALPNLNYTTIDVFPVIACLVEWQSVTWINRTFSK